MNFIKNIRRDFKDMPSLKSIKRIYDKKPIQCNMYITDRCNLSCKYCTEYNNSKPHPQLNLLKRRIDKIVELGVLKLALVGGEPLLHPDIEEIIQYAKSKNIMVSISTNGHLINDKMIEKLKNANLDIIQISVDRMTPSQITQKAVANIASKLEKIKQTEIKIHLSGVICEDTAPEIEEVLNFGLNHDIPTEIRLMHGNLSGQARIHSVPQNRGLELIQFQMELKKRGMNVHTTNALLSYQYNSLRKKAVKWKCLAGYKVFFVSADGFFWPCSLLKSNKKIEDITTKDMVGYNHKKECQSSCGIYCVISNSLFVEHPLKFMAREIPVKLKQYIRKKKK